MKIVFGSTTLAPGDSQGADNVRVDGQQIVQEVQFFRGAAAALYPRGSRGVSLQFVTHWIFNTAKLAEVFVLTHITDLPLGTADRSTVTCTCGAGSEVQPIYMANAVLESARVLRYTGVSVDVEYTIRGPNFQTTSP